VEDALSLALENLLSPVLLFFLLGIVAASLKSDLEIPPAVGKFLALYLMVAIGLRGGFELAHADVDAYLAALMLAAVLLSLLTPFVAYPLLRLARLDRFNAAGVAAAYGSVSVVTFVTALALLARADVETSGHMVAVLAVMELPAIVSGLLLARRARGGGSLRKAFGGAALRDALVSGSVLLLLGALLIGWATGNRGYDAVGGVLVDPLPGVLAIFLLDLGLIVVRRLRESRILRARVLAFGLYMPLLGAAIGLGAARLLGLGVGDATLLARRPPASPPRGRPVHLRDPLARRLVPLQRPRRHPPLPLGRTRPPWRLNP
jgi:uncharacterized protein